MANQTGLINLPSALPTTPPPATPPPPVAAYNPTSASVVNATSTGYTPKGFAVTDDQTVAGQINKIIAKDSPLMQRAATRANQQMNDRGLINSSIAVGAGQGAVMDAALPIAQQDAQTYSNANTNTVNAQNAALNFGASQANDTARQNAQLGTNVNLSNADAANTANREAASASNALTSTVLNNDNQLAVAKLNTQTQQAIATMDNQYKLLFQTSNDAANMYNQTVQNIASISQNQTMGQQAKDDAINSQLNMLNEALRVQQEVARQDAAAVDELNIEQYFQPTGSAPGSTNGSNLNVSSPVSLDPAFQSLSDSNAQGNNWSQLPAKLTIVNMINQARAGDISAQRQLSQVGIPWWQPNDQIDLTNFTMPTT